MIFSAGFLQVLRKEKLMDYSNLPDEDRYLEYKKNSSSLSKDMWETVSSFANTAGGVIILGVTEERNPNTKSSFCVTGVSNPHKLLEDFWSTADKSIQELLSKSVIEKRGNGRATRYGIKQTQEQIIALAQEIPNMMRKMFQTEGDIDHD